MKTVVAKFSAGGVYTCKYKIVDYPAEWHAENVPGLEDSLLPRVSDFEVAHFLRGLAKATGQTVEIREEGEAEFAHR